MKYINTLVKRDREEETHNRVSLVNSLISGGIEPVSLLLYKRLLSQNGERSLREHQQAKQVSVLHF